MFPTIMLKVVYNFYRYLIRKCILFLDDCAAIYRAGFSECTNEVVRLVMGMDGINNSVKTKILSHLTQTCQSVDKTPPTSPLTSSPSMIPVGGMARSPLSSPCGSPNRPNVSMFNASRPVLETARQIILPMHTHPQGLYPLQVKTEHKDLGRAPVSAFCRPCHQPPLASVKPIIKPTYIPSLSPDISKECSLNESKRSESVWRPW